MLFILENNLIKKKEIRNLVFLFHANMLAILQSALLVVSCHFDS